MIWLRWDDIGDDMDRVGSRVFRNLSDILFHFGHPPHSSGLTHK